MPLLALPFSPAHPAVPGHFPGQPIVPGVLLLDWAQAAIEGALQQPLQTLLDAKFHSPAGPSDVLELEFDTSASAVKFEIRSAARKIASGRFSLPAGTAP